MDSQAEYWTAAALLEWQVEMGADEAILDAPLDRYELEPAKPSAPEPATTAEVPSKPPIPTPPPAVDTVAVAARLAAEAGSLEALKEAIAGFEHCELRKGARNLVLSDGLPSARVMVISDAPTREDDMQGRPFTETTGDLLDRMFGAIGLTRTTEISAEGFYLVNMVPWRPPSDRMPTGEEVAMMLPFVQRHIDLVAPDVLVLLGGIPCQAFLGDGGTARLRGRWTEVAGRPALPIYHPGRMKRDPVRKRDTWADLLSLKAKLREMG